MAVSTGPTVVAIGGHSLLSPDLPPTVANQFVVTQEAMKPVADLLERGQQLVLTHGNGPQVGFMQLRSELARDTLLFRPLDRVLLKGKRRPVLVYEVVGVRDQVDDDTLAWVSSHTRALEVYFDGRFEEARVAFSKVLERRPDDGPATLMSQRCGAYLMNPPPPDWDGVHVAGD